MKKILILLMACNLSFTACAGDDKPIALDKLPTAAREFITTHFGQAKAMLTTMDKDLFSKSYKVVFENGDKIEFNRKGEWKDIESRMAVPDAIVPQPIKSYINSHFPGSVVKEIDRDKHDYEIKLNTGLELKFDKGFNLIDMDN